MNESIKFTQVIGGSKYLFQGPTGQEKRRWSTRVSIYSPTGRTWIPQYHIIPQAHFISPAKFPLIWFKNLPFRRTNSKIQHVFFKIFTINDKQKPESMRNKTHIERLDQNLTFVLLKQVGLAPITG